MDLLILFFFYSAISFACPHFDIIYEVESMDLLILFFFYSAISFACPHFDIIYEVESMDLLIPFFSIQQFLLLAFIFIYNMKLSQWIC
jgi:hypothetical protein